MSRDRYVVELFNSNRSPNRKIGFVDLQEAVATFYEYVGDLGEANNGEDRIHRCGRLVRLKDEFVMACYGGEIRSLSEAEKQKRIDRPIHNRNGKWYFWESNLKDRCGPFSTKGEAEQALRQYVASI